MVEKIKCDECGWFFPQDEKMEPWPELCEKCTSFKSDRISRNEQDFELGADYGRVNGWYSDTFGDSFSDPYDY